MLPVCDGRKSPSIPLFKKGEAKQSTFPHQFESHPLGYGFSVALCRSVKISGTSCMWQLPDKR